ncbi:hypothetical protein FT663_02654 [Candidozyma haemuli var. vulneris]|nr:hypothetical protein FT662_03618 [[Candida] haemuloni var. vulneris]KAF3991572.1 hypothetical protein FT663_02654 [[Candida] haemuloni var. vulneris]
MAPVITRPGSEENISSSYSETLPLGEYLFLRIAQANPKLRSVFGIPGDFNLALLEYLYTDSVAKDKGIDFVGICNELNAAYAADGYARVIQGLSVLITTYGVGELSAINGVAGAFAEYVPLLHIVGTTSTVQQNQAKSATRRSVRNIHHLVPSRHALTPPDHDVYKYAVQGVSCIQESLTKDDSTDNLDKIDRVLCKILQENRPGYLFVPSDVPDVRVPKSRLAEPLSLSELKDTALLDDVTDKILNKLYSAKQPSIFSDALIPRFRAQEQFTKFVESMPSNFVKLFASNLARNIDESLPNYVGCYYGKLTEDKKIIESIEQKTDVLLNIGYFNNETNNGFNSFDFNKVTDYVEIHPDYILIDDEYIDIKSETKDQRVFSFNDLMTKLAEKLDVSKFTHNQGQNNIDHKYEMPVFAERDGGDTKTITQNKLLDFMKDYLQPNDIFVVETCSFLFGVADLSLPKDVSFYSQSFYGSIGYALPATLGASRAERDLGTKRRVVLVQGDGSAQMTIQELSSYVRHDIQPPKIFLLNNEGYTVERLIRGPTRSYNDIQDNWRWTQLLSVLGDPEQKKHTAANVESAEQLTSVLKQTSLEDKIEFYELHLTKLDVPQRFSSMFR